MEEAVAKQNLDEETLQYSLSNIGVRRDTQRPVANYF